MKTAIYFNELQPLLYGYYICKGVIFLHRKISAAVFTVLTAMSMCGCTSDKNTVGQSTGRNGRGGRTPAETAFLTDGSEKVCYGQGYETDNDNRPVGATQAQEKYGSYGGRFIFGKDDKTICLTFDEGYENGCTGKILDILKEKKVTATFYVTLDYVKSSPELVSRMINEGHEVGNHSCTHPSLPDISDDMVFEEIHGLETYISDNFGGYKTVTMRPPRGEFSVRTLRIAKNMGYDTVLWSFAYNDWNTDAQPDRDTAYRRITSATHNGAVYLLHAVSETNTAILPDVIDYWLDNGYTVKSISG